MKYGSLLMLRTGVLSKTIQNFKVPLTVYEATKMLRDITDYVERKWVLQPITIYKYYGFILHITYVNHNARTVRRTRDVFSFIKTHLPLYNLFLSL